MGKLLDRLLVTATGVLVVWGLNSARLALPIVAGALDAPAPASIVPPDLGKALRGASWPLGDGSDVGVEVVVFLDYACQACRADHARLERLQAELAGRVLFRVFPFPLVRPGSWIAATIALCSVNDGSFPAVHQALMGDPTVPRTPFERVAAGSSELDLTDSVAFRNCIQSEEAWVRTVELRDLAGAAGVRGTPTWLIDDQLYEARASQMTGLLERASTGSTRGR